jgi:hypothetical protein
MRTDEIANKLEHFFVAEKGYSAVPTQIIQDNGKRKFTYTAIRGEINTQSYRNHIKTEVGLTPSPLIDHDKCYWGAIDIDTYNMEGAKKKEIIEGAKELHLAPAFSKSQGIHLYCVSKDKILAKAMRNYLAYCRATLKLDPKTEIFPKQDEVSITEENGFKKFGYGNGITIPYRSFEIHADKDQPWGIEIYKEDKIRLLQPLEFFRLLDQIELPGDFFKRYYDISIEDNSELYESSNPNYAEGSIQDPEMQKLSGKEIIQKIRDEKMSLDDDESFFDDMVTLYIAKGVSAFKTDEKILAPLISLPEKQTGVKAPYYRQKLNKARLTQNIDDPIVARRKFINNVVYIKQNNKYFDLTTNQEYSKDAINFEYSRIYANEKGGPVFHLQNSPKRRSVENWVYDPTQYKKDEPLIKINKLSYLNSYKPNDLVAVKGDTQPWHRILDHVFSGPSKYKDHFINFHAFNLQNPGIKQRHGLVIVSTEFQFGKGSLFRGLQLCYGIDNSLAIDIKQALDKSKGYLCNSMLVLIDEMQSSGKWEETQNVLNDMKRIITEKEVSSRSLYVDYKIIKTCTNYMFFSNKKDALKLPPNEVRYWVYLTSRPRLPQQYYTEYHKWLDKGGAQHILYELLNHKIPEDYDPQGVAPSTPFLTEMSERGEHPITQVIRQMYEEYEFPLREDVHIIGSTELFEYLQSKKMTSRARINDVANALEIIGGKCLGQCRVNLPGQKRAKPTLYLIRNVAELGHNQPQQLVDKFYHPIEIKPDHENF